ncbi:MAG: dehydrogenase [Planctomycetes bacterium B3_Pla]|nr:MAG: dehydrogenase [Planctomycetes bacterium B3_Pla]
MSRISRRHFLASSLYAGAATIVPRSRVMGANNDIRMGIVGLGSFVKIGGKGRGDLRDFRKIPGVRIAAICDCDRDHVAPVLKECNDKGERVKAYTDVRELLDNKEIDAVSITTPNHWHSLIAIWACQAGKDVFVQKPASHNIFEGRKMVEAAAKYNRVVQATHGPRSNGALEAAFEYARKGNLGKMLYVHGLNYRPRMSIGKVTGPQPVPESCDYNLWCGPAPKKTLMRENLHYDWHWDWDTGNGDLGNMGIHFVDSCRWAVDQMELPKRVIGIGGRFAYDDDGQTPNTLITLLDYEPVPILFEVRGLPKSKSVHDQKWSRNMDTYLGEKFGAVVHCENGYVLNGAAYDKKGELIEEFTSDRISTKQNFIDVMRNRKTGELYTDALDGHLSCGLLHMANISYRLGRETRPGRIRETIRGNKVFAKSFDRIAAHLDANGVDLKETPAALGPMLEFNPRAEKFVGEFSQDANRLVSRDYRKPFVVPEKV